MRPNHQNRRMRGRNRKGPNPLTRSYESNGPDVKVRGTPQHIAEKYTQLARDAQLSGDPVMAESYLQHAEHYIRIIIAAQTLQQQQQGGFRNAESGEAEDEIDDLDEETDRFAFTPPQVQRGNPQGGAWSGDEPPGFGPQPGMPGQGEGAEGGEGGTPRYEGRPRVMRAASRATVRVAVAKVMAAKVMVAKDMVAKVMADRGATVSADATASATTMAIAFRTSASGEPRGGEPRGPASGQPETGAEGGDNREVADQPRREREPRRERFERRDALPRAAEAGDASGALPAFVTKPVRTPPAEGDVPAAEPAAAAEPVRRPRGRPRRNPEASPADTPAE